MSAPPTQSHERYERIFAEVEAPFAFVDLDAMWANAEAMLERAGGKPMSAADFLRGVELAPGEILGK